jgi:hypothetical protein
VSREAVYADPIDVVWIGVAARLGLEVRRADDAYAAWDGRGVLTIATRAEMDPDDHLGQMILHELCHALVAGEGALSRVDWGLPIEDDEAAVAEHAVHRLQAALADRHGLRGFFGVTTAWRPYWDALPDDPLADGADPAIALARAAVVRATTGPWAGPIADALAATAAIVGATAAFAPPGSLFGRV